jgi:hypothetical protein
VADLVVWQQEEEEEEQEVLDQFDLDSSWWDR